MNIKYFNTRFIHLGVIALFALPGFSNAQASDPEALIAIVDAIEKGWEQGDGTPFREHFLDFEGARYVESGGQNEGLTDLVEHHVEPEVYVVKGFRTEGVSI